MKKNVAIVVLGVVVVVLGGLLVQKGCDPLVPVDPDPTPVPTQTPTPTPQSGEPCQYLTVEFKAGVSTETRKYAVFAHPENLDDAQECAMIIFSNKTDTAIKLEFLASTSPTKSPFTGIEAIELEPYGEETQFSKGFTVAVEVPNGVPYLEYKYEVADVGPPETEQSPRIRIGPRQASVE
ncbi:MAG: hypothetical protein AB1Z65_17080 [Candidatus Sulfomarinibacteraceae bacterium]